MKRISWFDIALRCLECNRTTYRPARGSRECQWCEGKLMVVIA